MYSVMETRPKDLQTFDSLDHKVLLHLAHTRLQPCPVIPKRMQQSWSHHLPRAAVIAGCLAFVLAVLSLPQEWHLSREATVARVKLEHRHWTHRNRTAGGTHSCRRRFNSSSTGIGDSSRIEKASYQAGGLQSIWRRPAIVLIGDSLTEWGVVDQGWTAMLSNFYRRKADVINRGFSGYNTRSMLLGLCEITDWFDRQHVLLATVWLGANDAALLDRRHGAAHVPLENYGSNLENITQQLQAAGAQHVVVMTPPPVWEQAPEALKPGDVGPPRTFNTTAAYAAAVREAAAKQSALLLDVWHLFVSQQGWQQQLLARDGLHLSKQGQWTVYNGLVQLLESQLPHLLPSALPWHHPRWSVMYNEAEQLFAAERAAYQEEFEDTACTSCVST